MKLRLLKAAVTTALCVSLVAPQSTLAGPAQLHSKIPPAIHPPARIPVKEPVRVRASLPAVSATQPKLSQGVRPLNGRHVATPPMLRPLEIDDVLKAAAVARKRALATRTGASTVEGTRLPGRGRVAARPAARGSQSLPSDLSATGAGINAWWRYREEAIPGGGRAMVNVGTGNLVLQDDDMSVAHKGIPMEFRRTYNSQASTLVIAGRESLYGAGWTNSFDAHIAGSASGTITVSDFDGARYDYTLAADGVTRVPPPGQHATLVPDGGCGYLWTKTSGASYYFWTPDGAAPCTASWYPSYGAYAGRLYQIIGRNRNSYITFIYSWDNGNSSPGVGKISSIAAQTESGMTATLNFADFNGHRLLQQLTFPDGATTVQYGYGNFGNLVSVSHPPNNAAGTRPTQGFGYQVIGSDRIIYWTQSARSFASCGTPAGCRGDGGGHYFGFMGTSAATSTLSSIERDALVNPTVLDGSNSGALQGAQYPTNAFAYNTEYFTTGVTTPTFRDTDGRMVNWVVDGLGRPSQTQQCTESASQGQQCTGSWLVQNESWDANNNRIGTVDPRGGAMTMFYDAGGNAVAIEQPRPYEGWNPPTTLIDYDSFGNVTAVCDPALVYNSWTGQYGAGADNYCVSQFGTANHWNAQYAYPSYQPYGQPISVTSPSGYVRTISYDPGSQGGADYGLPTATSGVAIVQFDQSTRRPSESAKYDNNGNVVCASTDAGTGSASSIATMVLTYDVLNRLTAAADADDSSLPGSCGKAPGISGSTIVTRTTYFADGSLATTQTPSEAARTSGTVYSYDLDGNRVSEAPYTGNPQSAQTPFMKRWFDGADRLVETQEPADPATPGDIPISQRYLYDLSKSGAASTLAGASVVAHGNLFDTVKNTPSGWIDFTYAALTRLIVRRRAMRSHLVRSKLDGPARSIVISPHSVHAMIGIPRHSIPVHRRQDLSSRPWTA